MRAFYVALFAVSLAACSDNDPEHNEPDLNEPDYKVFSGFEENEEGWTIVGEAKGSSVKPDYAGTGGNPDGFISAADAMTGGVWYFSAPSKYLGDNSDAYGKILKYDLTVTPYLMRFGDRDVILEGAGLTIWYDTSPDPDETWTTYSVMLTEDGWKSGPYDVPVPVNAADFRNVLGDTTALLIRGEFNTGPDTGSLDNVTFGAAPGGSLPLH